MQRFDRKNVNGMLMSLAAIAIIPVGLWLTRPRPLSGENVNELISVVRNSREDEVLEQMVRRYEAVSLNFEGLDTDADPKLRWKIMQTSLEEDGVGLIEAQKVLKVAQKGLKDNWPCLVEKGYVQDEPVWFVVGNVPRDTGFIGWICRPSAKDIRDEKLRKYCFNVQVSVVSALPPYRALN